MSVLLGHFAGFWRRGLAFLLDEVITTIPSYLLGQGTLYVAHLLFAGDRPFDQSFPESTKVIVGLLADFFVSVPYQVGFHYVKGWTPGKRVLNSIVLDYKTKGPITLKQSVIRYFAKILALIPFGAGFLMAAWDKEKRGLHDLIAGTVVYKFQTNPLEEQK